MPDFFSYFSPKKLETSSGDVKNGEIFEEEDNANVTPPKPNLILDEGDVDGILNANYSNCCGHGVDLSSVESLSMALLKLESEKESLESEIHDHYDRMNVTQLREVVTRIISVTQIENEETADEENSEEINELFELLKSTASFVDRRLKKLRLGDVGDLSSDAERFKETLPLSASEEHQVCVTYSEEDRASWLDLKSSANEANFIDEKVPAADDGIPIVDLKLNGVDDTEEPTSNEAVNEKQSDDANDSDKVSEVEEESKQDESIQDIKAKFGPGRTRWSIRKVFKKNF